MDPKWSLHPPSIDFRGVHASLDYTLFDYLRLDYYFGQQGHLDNSRLEIKTIRLNF